MYQRRRTYAKQPARPVRRAVRPVPYQRMSGQGAYYPRRSYYPYRRATGRGDYTVDNGPFANFGARVGGYAGKAAGGPIGEAAGSWLGRRLFHYPAKLFGSGDYQMGQAPEKLAPQVPAFENAKDGSVLICHREYIGDIISSSSANTFQIQSFGINPGNPQAFPWLSNIAIQSFQQYKFEGCIFEFRTFSADALNSTNTALGAVFAAINYDYSDDDFSSRYEVENTDWSMSCKPSENMLIPVECKGRLSGLNGGLLYVLNSATVPSGTDPKTYYLGKLFIGTTGFQGTSVNCGSLYVTYKIRLLKPILAKPLSNALLQVTNRTSADGTNNFGTATNTSTATQLYACDSIGVTYGAKTFTMNKSRLRVGQMFMLNVYWQGNSTASVVSPSLALSSNATGYTYYGAFTTPAASAPTPANTSAYLLLSVVFTILDNNSDVVGTLSGGTIPSGASVDILIAEICGIPLNQIGFV